MIKVSYQTIFLMWINYDDDDDDDDDDKNEGFVVILQPSNIYLMAII